MSTETRKKKGGAPPQEVLVSSTVATPTSGMAHGGLETMDVMQSLMSGLAQQMGRLVTDINEKGAEAVKLTQVREDRMQREAEH